VAGVELVVADDLAVVRLVPEWSNTNYITYRSIMINSLTDICTVGKNRLPTVVKCPVMPETSDRLVTPYADDLLIM
jgi:hypothetical protein